MHLNSHKILSRLEYIKDIKHGRAGWVVLLLLCLARIELQIGNKIRGQGA